MKVLVFGASGPAGRSTVKEALARGHQVTAYVRNASKAPDGAQLIVGELSDSARLSSAIAGQEAVISLLGPGPKAKGTPVADGMQRIVKLMGEHQVKRLIATATPSAKDSRDGFSFPFALAVVMIRGLAGNAYAEIVQTAEVVRTSGLDWTLARLPMLSDAPTAEPARAGFLGQPGIKLFSLSRDALARFLVEQLTERAWLHQAPVLSNA